MLEVTTAGSQAGCRALGEVVDAILVAALPSPIIV